MGLINTLPYYKEVIRTLNKTELAKIISIMDGYSETVYKHKISDRSAFPSDSDYSNLPSVHLAEIQQIFYDSLGKVKPIDKRLIKKGIMILKNGKCLLVVSASKESEIIYFYKIYREGIKSKIEQVDGACSLIDFKQTINIAYNSNNIDNVLTSFEEKASYIGTSIDENYDTPTRDTVPVYLNTNLSIEKVKNIMNNVTYVYKEEAPLFNVYEVISGKTYTTDSDSSLAKDFGIQLCKLSEEGYQLFLANNIDIDENALFIQITGNMSLLNEKPYPETSGFLWLDSQKSANALKALFELDGVTIDFKEGFQYGVPVLIEQYGSNSEPYITVETGDQNDKISELFSKTVFELNNEEFFTFNNIVANDKIDFKDGNGDFGAYAKTKIKEIANVSEQQYYRIVLTENLGGTLNLNLQLFIEREDFVKILTTVSGILEFPVVSAEQLVGIYNTVKSDSISTENYNNLVGIFYLIGLYNLTKNLNNIYMISDSSAETPTPFIFKIIGAIPQKGLMLGTGYSTFTRNAPSDDTEFQMRFLANSSLTIGIVNNQELD